MSTFEAARLAKRVNTLDADDLYPVSDGQPMAETDEHANQMIYCRDALRGFFVGRMDVYVSGNNFLYWERGTPSAVISPDGYVCFGVSNEFRDTYKLWEVDGVTPSFVIEITSKKTQKEDGDKKKKIYQDILKVPEYFQFDVTSDYLNPNLQGWRLEKGKYRKISSANPREKNRLYSEVLGLFLVAEGRRMRFYDPVSQRFLLSYTEQAEQITSSAQALDFMERRVAMETQRAEQESEARLTAEAELARLRAEMDSLRQQLEQRQ